MMNKVFTKMHAVSVIALMAVSPWTVAVEILLENELKVYAQHDNNINLSASDETSLYGEVVNPKAQLTMRTESWSSQLNADLRFAEYNRDGYESDDQYLTFVTNRKGERSEFNVTANAVHDTTRTSEELGSGRFSNDRHNRYALASTWSYYATDRNVFKIQASLSRDDYDNPRYNGYDIGAGFVEWGYVVNEQLQLFARITGDKFIFEEQTNLYPFYREETLPPPLPPLTYLAEIGIEQTIEKESTSTGFKMGASYQWNEKLNLFGLFGRSDTETSLEVDTVNNECENPVWVATSNCSTEDQNKSTDNSEFRATWEEERQSFLLKYSVTTNPSSDGRVLEYQRVDLQWRYELTETGAFIFTTQWGKNEEIEEPDNAFRIGFSNREFITTTAAYNHRLTENWYINASVRYRYQERAILTDEAEGLGGTIGISYFFDKKQW